MVQSLTVINRPASQAPFTVLRRWGAQSKGNFDFHTGVLASMFLLHRLLSVLLQAGWQLERVFGPNGSLSFTQQTLIN